MRFSAGAVRNCDCQNARVSRARVSWRGADARPAGDPAALRIPEFLNGRFRLRRRSFARRIAGPGQPDAALPGQAHGARQHFCAACVRAGLVGMLAGLYPGRIPPLYHRGHRPRVQGHHHPRRPASHHHPPRHSSRDRDGGRGRADHAGRHRAGRAVHGGHAQGDGRCRSADARGSRICALGHPAWPAADGNAPQRGEPGRRFHVSGERSRAGRNRCEGNAAGGRDQHRVFDPDCFHRDRHISVPYPRALRYRRYRRTRSASRRTAMTGFSFDGASAVLIIPAIAAALLVALPGYRLAARLNVLAALLTFIAALSLFFGRPPPGNYLLVDDLNNVFIVLTTFVAFTTSVFSASYIGHELEIGRLTPSVLRFYHAMYQVLMFAMNLALITNNIGVMWVAIELATLTTVLMVGIYRTHEALEAAWKYFILGSVGIALALFGTILVYMAALPVIGEGLDAMIWTVLIEHAGGFDPALLNLAFVFLLLGYGTKVGLAPLHAWLPDAHAEGPTPISAVLSGLLLNVALYALLRFKLLLAATPQAIAPGPLIVTLGLTSLVFAAFMLYRRRDIKRMFAYSSIEHMGIITFAFGIGGPLANFAGLLHMTMHSLTKSAIFFAVGHIAQTKGTQKIADMGGLTETHPVLGWGLVLGVVAIAGLPPLGIFMSEFLIVSSTFAREPWLAIILALGILIAFGGLFLRLNTIAFGDPRGPTAPAQASYVPMFVHLAIVFAAGIYMPPPLVAGFQNVAKLLG